MRLFSPHKETHYTGEKFEQKNFYLQHFPSFPDSPRLNMWTIEQKKFAGLQLKAVRATTTLFSLAVATQRKER